MNSSSEFRVLSSESLRPFVAGGFVTSLRRSVAWLLAIGLTVFVGRTGWAQCPPLGPNEDPAIPQQVMVRVLDTADPNAVVSEIQQRWPGITVFDSISSRRIYLLDIPDGTVDCDVELDLQANMVFDPNAPDPNRPLRWAERNYEGQGIEGQTGSIYISYQLPDGQTRYQDQYVTNLLGMSAAQSMSTGSGVAVALLDTGVDAAHPELAGRVLDGFNFVNLTTNTADVGDAADNDGDGAVDELVGHGTFVAGLITLTAPEAKILPVVVLDSDGVGDGFRFAQGLFYAIDHGVEVINLSLSSTYKAEAVEDAIEEAQRLGIVVVAAAGNEDTQEPEEYPAMGGHALGVAATDETDVKAPFSNYGDKLFISAPGTSAPDPNGGFDPQRTIYSTVPGGDFAVWEGTSFSTALVSGTVALIRAQHPEWPPNEITHGQIQGILAASAVPIDAVNDPNLADLLGVGRLDTAAAVGDLPTPTPGDLDNDGTVDLDDLTLLLRDFGAVHSSADLDADGRVDLDDLTTLLMNFGL